MKGMKIIRNRFVTTLLLAAVAVLLMAMADETLARAGG